MADNEFGVWFFASDEPGSYTVNAGGEDFGLIQPSGWEWSVIDENEGSDIAASLDGISVKKFGDRNQLLQAVRDVCEGDDIRLLASGLDWGHFDIAGLDGVSVHVQPSGWEFTADDEEDTQQIPAAVLDALDGSKYAAYEDIADDIRHSMAEQAPAAPRRRRQPRP